MARLTLNGDAMKREFKKKDQYHIDGLNKRIPKKKKIENCISILKIMGLKNGINNININEIEGTLNESSRYSDAT